MDEKENIVSIEVSSGSVQESNLILRKLYEELNESAPLGWEFMPFREETDIFLGNCTLGRVYLHYKEKGKIDRITFHVSDLKNKAIVERAIKAANENHSTFVDYIVQVEFTIKHIVLKEMAKQQIHIIGEKGDNRDHVNRLVVTFNIKAFGDYDVRYIVTQKTSYLRLLLCVYTNLVFELPDIRIARGKKEFADVNWTNFDEEWLESFYEPSAENEAFLLPDFFALFRYVLDNDYYGRTMRLVLNASQDYFCALLMKKRLLDYGNDYIPGIVDTINTLLLSTLEPLSCIGKEPPQICPTCGNVIYKISSHIRCLCEKYLGEHLARDIVKRGYRNRSAFLHEGNATTNEFYCGTSYPQLDPNKPNEILWVIPALEYNYFDYISFVFRRTIHDLLQEPTCFDE